MLPGLTSIRLTAFKSFRNQNLRLGALTLIVGRNASGKSNALDGLSLLALLADERDVNDLERGDQDVAGLRGGLSGAAPFGTAVVKVGCSVETASGNTIDFDVALDASMHPEVISESLVWRRPGGNDIRLVHAKRKSKGAGISEVQVYSSGNPRSHVPVVETRSDSSSNEGADGQQSAHSGSRILPGPGRCSAWRVRA